MANTQNTSKTIVFIHGLFVNPKSWADHPITRLRDLGLSVGVNTDDPGIFGISLVGEYEKLARDHGWTVEDFEKANREAFKASFIKDKEKFFAGMRPRPPQLFLPPQKLRPAL